MSPRDGGARGTGDGGRWPRGPEAGDPGPGSGGSPLPVRLYAFLLRICLPGLGAEYLDEAAAAFGDLRREARIRGTRATVAFYVRELRALLRTTAETRRARRKRQSSRSGNRFDILRQDLRYALRGLARSPGFVVITVLSLTVGMAVSTMVFSAGNAAFFRPVPHVANQDGLVRIFRSTRRLGRGPSSFPDYEDIRDGSETLTDVAAMGSRSFSVGVVAQGTRQVWGEEVSENYFQVLGIPLARGRGFLPEDVDAGGRVAVIGYNTWQREFGGAPDVLGQTLHLDGQPYTVVGVGPEGMVAFDGPLLLEITVPVMEFRGERGRQSLGLVGRMREGVTLPQVQAELDGIARHLAETYPNYWNHEGDGPEQLRALTSRQARIPEGAPLAAVFGGIGALVGLILLIACSNVANLLLTRASRRRAEIAIRCAIGAPTRRIFRQLLTENLLLFGAAGGLGLLATQWLASVLGSGWVVIQLPGIEMGVDVRVALFALAVTLATGLTFGLIPALQASRPDLIPALKGMGPALRTRLLGFRNLLVGAQVGGTLVLVLVTLLLVRSLSHARTIDLGFDPTGVATLSLDLSPRELGPEEGSRFYTELMERVAALQGVEDVGLASWVPLAGGSTRQGGLQPEGYEAGPQEFILAGSTTVTPGYLALTRMRLLRGRDFGPEDGPGSPEVALVNQSFVDRFWPGEGGVGKRIGTGGERGGFLVVGVVANVPYVSLSGDVEPHMWLPLAQNYQPELILHARTSGDPRALLPLMRQQVGELDPDLPVIQADLMENISAHATQPQRLLSAALGGAGIFTLVLAVLGIYGVVAYSVSRRTREMGLRMALGAEPRRVMAMVIREGVVLSLIGLLPGLLVALVASRLLEAVLLGMNPLDPLAFSGGVALLLLAVMGASLAPGIRAARAHPMESLRTE